jgi:hypothetical protein
VGVVLVVVHEGVDEFVGLQADALASVAVVLDGLDIVDDGGACPGVVDE